MASKEWTSGGSPVAGTRIFAIICSVLALPLLLTAGFLTEDRLSSVAAVLATPRGELNAPARGRAFYEGKLHARPDRTTPLGTPAAAWIGVVRWKTGSGKSKTDHSCMSGELGGLLLSDSSTTVGLSGEGFSLERAHTSGGRPAETTKLKPECAEHLDEGEYEEQFFANGDAVTVAACFAHGRAGSTLAPCEGEGGLIAAGSIDDKHIEARASARLSSWIVIMLATAFSVMALVAHMHSDRRVVVPPQEDDA